MNEARFDLDDPAWDPRDRKAYLADLRRRAEQLQQTRGRLTDCFGRDRSDILVVPEDGGLTPLLVHVQEDTLHMLDERITGIHMSEA